MDYNPVLAIRQILLEKNAIQVVFEPNTYADQNDIPTMTHYDGNLVPIHSVSLPEAIPEDQRLPGWTPERMSTSVVLCCEDRGFIFYELFSDDNKDINWLHILSEVYDWLADPENAPAGDEWLEEFVTATKNGVPPLARVLRARLLRDGYTTHNHLVLQKPITVVETLTTEGNIETFTHKVDCIWPQDDTVCFIANANTIDEHFIDVRNTHDDLMSLSFRIDWDPLTGESLAESRQFKAILELRDFVKNKGGYIKCYQPFKEYYVETDSEVIAHITGIGIQCDGRVRLHRESYAEESIDNAEQYEPEFLEGLLRSLRNLDDLFGTVQKIEYGYNNLSARIPKGVFRPLGEPEAQFVRADGRSTETVTLLSVTKDEHGKVFLGYRDESGETFEDYACDHDLKDIAEVLRILDR